jgi:1,4-alpha-glucan branching enzyme
LTKHIVDDNVPAYYFHQGTNFCSYDYLGCHETKKNNEYEYVFRVWAPNADSVRLVSDFTSWDVGEMLNRITEAGIWEIKISAKERLCGKFYKYKIWNKGNCYYKADPFAFYSQTHLETASIVANIDDFSWEDDNWLEYRKRIFEGTNVKSSDKYY